MSYTSEQQQWLADMQKKREMEKLQRLQQKYPVTPNYSMMNLCDIDEMNQFQPLHRGLF